MYSGSHVQTFPRYFSKVRAPDSLLSWIPIGLLSSLDPLPWRRRTTRMHADGWRLRIRPRVPGTPVLSSVCTVHKKLGTSSNKLPCCPDPSGALERLNGCPWLAARHAVPGGRRMSIVVRGEGIAASSPQDLGSF